MKILFLTQILPYPPDAGPRVKTWNVIRFLKSAGHQVDLVSFVREAEKPYISELELVCDSVTSIPIKRSRIADLLFAAKSVISGRPFLVERDRSNSMMTALVELAQQNRYDVLHADQLSMVQFALELRQKLLYQPAVIFDAHNATWTIFERSAEKLKQPFRNLVRWEGKRIKSYEFDLVRQCDHTLTVTEIDRLALINQGKNEPVNYHKVTSVPIAVDTNQMGMIQRIPDEHEIVTLGTLHYPPNADGIRWFLEEVFPLVKKVDPKAHLTIIGKNPPVDFLMAAEKEPQNITVTGYVQKLEPYFEKAGVIVIPVRAGGGMRVRILEAFSRGLPVVTTTVGLEGIEAQHNEHVLVEDSVQGFANAVIRLLSNPEDQQKIANRARILAVHTYDWHVVLNKLNAIYENLAK